MTEAEWLAAGERQTDAAVAALGGRRARLCAVHACRAMLSEPWAVVDVALDVCEAFAETGRTKVALKRASQSLRAERARCLDVLSFTEPTRERKFRLLWATEVACSERLTHAAIRQTSFIPRCDGQPRDVGFRQVYRLYADLAGPPGFAFALGWRSSAAVAIARGAYDALDFSRLPVLADALEDTGCDAADLLAHLRGPGPHACGCWALDAVLGKG